MIFAYLLLFLPVVLLNLSSELKELVETQTEVIVDIQGKLEECGNTQIPTQYVPKHVGVGKSTHEFQRNSTKTLPERYRKISNGPRKLQTGVVVKHSYESL